MNPLTLTSWYRRTKAGCTMLEYSLNYIVPNQSTKHMLTHNIPADVGVSSGEAPTPASTSMFTM